MKQSKLLTGGLAALASAAVVVGSALPAHAEPVRPYAAVGSDTTQDVWNGLTNDGAPLGSIANYDAFDGTGVSTGDTQLIKTKTSGIWFTRPAGSGNGVRALSAAWDTSNPPSTRTWRSKQLLNEEVDFARSSSGPSGATTDLTYLPFARDAVSVAYNPGSVLPSNLNLTTSQIKELYTGVDDPSNDSAAVTASIESGVPKINGVTVSPKIPQNGSGTRSFFLSAVGITAANFASYIVDGTAPENNGSAIPNAGDLIPFSAAQWIAQSNGVQAGAIAGLVLASINGAAPTTGTAPELAPGPLYGSSNLQGYNTVPATGAGNFNRDVYNVIPTLFRTGTAKQANLVSLLTSTTRTSAATAIIKRYGFGTLTYSANSANFRTGSYLH